MSSPSSKLPNLTTKTEEFISFVEKSIDTPIYKLTPEEARKILIDLQRKNYKEIPADIIDRNIFCDETGNIDLRIVRPLNSGNKKLPIILFIHGGGWILGNKETHDMLMRKIVNKTNAMIIFPNYSLSPENKFPTAINEIYSTLKYVYHNPQEFNADENKIIIIGDSAGGNMATVTAIMAKKENGPKLLAQILLYPVTNTEMDTQSYSDFKEGPWLTKKAMEWFMTAYAPEKEQRESIYVSPLKADLEELSGLPLTIIITDENDILRDEGEAYARKLDMADVKTLNIRTNGTIHDFMIFNALADTMPAKFMFNFICNTIKRIFEE